MSKSKWILAVLAAVVLAVAASGTGRAEGGPSAAGGLAAADSPAGSLKLLDLNTGTDGSGVVTVTLKADGELAHESSVLANPDRVVLDLPGVVNHLERYRFPVEGRGLTGVRAAQHALVPRPVTRVVFDLDGPRSYRVESHGSSLLVSFGEEEGAVAAYAHATVPATQPTTEPAPEPVAEPVLADLVQELESRFPVEEPRAAAAAPSLTAAPPAPAQVPAGSGRSVEPDLIEKLLRQPAFAAPSQMAAAGGSSGPTPFETRTIVTDQVSYSGKEINLNLVDADIKQVFRLFHEISGLNFVLDPSVGGKVTIVLDRVPWDQALDIILKNNGLDKVMENNVIRIASTQKLAQEAASRKQLKEAKELEVEPITITRTLSYGKAQDVERVIRDSGVLTSRGKVIVDERTNTLIVSDIQKKVEPLDRLITTLDSETPQVMIEARVVETSRNFERNLGVVWGVEAIADASKGTSTGLSFPHNASLKYGLNLPGTGGASNLAMKFGNVIDSFTLDVQLNALEDEGSARVLSSPKIATQNNERAEIEQGVRIPIVNTTATEISVEYVSASLKMTVTPQITAEGTIILDVIVENNSPDFVQTAGGIPSIRTQRAQTKVLITDGGTTVIGGIFTVTDGDTERGVPWFRKVPVFGWLFKQQQIKKENRELLIFITPKIMRVA